MLPDTTGADIDVPTALSNAQHHIRVIRPIANLSSFAVSVLKDLAIMRDAVGIFLCHILIGHEFRARPSASPGIHKISPHE